MRASADQRLRDRLITLSGFNEGHRITRPQAAFVEDLGRDGDLPFRIDDQCFHEELLYFYWHLHVSHAAPRAAMRTGESSNDRVDCIWPHPVHRSRSGQIFRIAAGRSGSDSSPKGAPITQVGLPGNALHLQSGLAPAPAVAALPHLDGVEPGTPDTNGCVLLCVQHSSYRYRETFEQRRGRLCPARKHTMFDIGGPRQA